MTASPRVVFRVAAGPKLGFGHLVRCRSLARALDVEPIVSVRGTRRTRRIAASLGWSVVDVSTGAALAALAPAAIVIDDPSGADAAVWTRRARRLKIPVATVHDLGIGRVSSDLAFEATHDPILDPSVARARERARRPVPRRVLIALGGGAHVCRLAARIATAIARRRSDLRICAARGFTACPRQATPDGMRWVSAPDGLADQLSLSTVAVLAGGVTLYEACALGVPSVAVAVTPAQHHTIRAVAAAGAAIDGGCPPLDDAVIERVADAAVALASDWPARRQLSAAGRRLVDGRGAHRAADRLRRLTGASRHAA